MFGSRRHRPPLQPLTAATADPSATTAAASAFNRHPPTNSLSSAAAATALRARPITPTNVGQVQTKRTIRRSASASSTGGDRRGSLRRSSSAGSMAERTLRSPSPHRPASSKSAHEPPPVPAIPDRTTSGPFPILGGPNGRHIVGLSTDTVKPGSDSVKECNTTWLGPHNAGPDGIMRTGDAVIPRGRHGRPSSQSSSINFSYPRGARAFSPQPGFAPAPTALPISEADQELVFDPNSRRMVPKAELLALDQSLIPQTRKPSKRKKKSKKKQTPTPVDPVESGPFSPFQDPTVEQQGLAEAQRAHEAPELVTGQMYNDMGPEIHVEPNVHKLQPQPSNPGAEADLMDPHVVGDEGMGATLFRQSSPAIRHVAAASQLHVPAVHEIAGMSAAPKHPAHVLDAVPVRSSSRPATQSLAELPTESRRPKTSPTEPISATIMEGNDRPPRKAPAAHQRSFSLGGETRLRVPERHSPPPRSLSPIKPALKHPTGANPGSSNASEASVDRDGHEWQHTSQQGKPARKKSVRVSFDDESNVVVGEAAPLPNGHASTVLPHEVSRPWYCRGRSHDGSGFLNHGDDDDFMKPRPALPSFGSIRDKRVKDLEERRLVRPRPSSYSGSTGVLPTIPSISSLGAHAQSFSSDRVIGEALSTALDPRHEANTSRFREPLPPEVTSVEGDGFLSDASFASTLSSSDDEDSETDGDDGELAKVATEGTILTEESAPCSTQVDNATSTTDGLPVDHHARSTGETNEASSSGQGLPLIAVTHPTPKPVEEQSDSDSVVPGSDSFTPPGSFPEDGLAGDDIFFTPGQETKTGSCWLRSIQSSGPAQAVARTTPAPTKTAFTTPEIPETIDEESDGSSIYSDAYEDLSEIESGGFQSLDAVVEIPVTPSPQISRRTREEAISRIATEAAADGDQPITSERATTPRPARQSTTEDPTDADWDKAKTFWRSLSAAKRRQLEQEVMDECAAAAHADEPSTDKPGAPVGEQKQSVEGGHDPERVYQIAPGTKLPDATQAAGPSFRSSMRNSLQLSKNGTISFNRSAMKQGKQGRASSLKPASRATPDPATAQRKSTRFAQEPDYETSPEMHSSEGRRHAALPLTSASLKAASKLEETPSHAADSSWGGSRLQRQDSVSSESSFVRTRPHQSGHAGFRRSMRMTDADTLADRGSDTSKIKGGFRFRSLSPARGPFWRQSVASTAPPVSTENKMRTSLRSDSSDGSSRHMRMPSFGRLSRKPDKRASASRLGDSSDDEDPVAVPMFRSQGGAGRERALSRARGSHVAVANGSPPPVPKRPFKRETLRQPVAVEDSEELTDSSNGDLPSVTPPTSPPVAERWTNVPESNLSLSRSRSGRGNLSASLGTQALSGKAERGRRGNGLMSVLRRNKADRSGGGGIKRPELIESAARRDTKLERSTAELEAIRSRDDNSQGQHVTWPLDEVPGGDENKHPLADMNQRKAQAEGWSGSPASPSSKLKKRRAAAGAQSGMGMGAGMGMDGVQDRPEPTNRSGKKKFAALRRVLSLGTS